MSLTFNKWINSLRNGLDNFYSVWTDRVTQWIMKIPWTGPKYVKHTEQLKNIAFSQECLGKTCDCSRLHWKTWPRKRLGSKSESVVAHYRNGKHSYFVHWVWIPKWSSQHSPSSIFIFLKPMIIWPIMTSLVYFFNDVNLWWRPVSLVDTLQPLQPMLHLWPLCHTLLCHTLSIKMVESLLHLTGCSF